MMIVIMGVAGSGKTTVGRSLSSELGWPYFDGDDFHSQTAIETMRNGKPLNDQDRAAWLSRLHDLVLSLSAERKNAVMSCSALKKKYREFLRSQLDAHFLRFVYLKVSPAVARTRMKKRVGHFMRESLLLSQFETLEPPTPDEALCLQSDELSVSKMVSIIRSEFRLARSA
jgi:gluconokinase